jgi:hypothetical protein
MRRQRADQHVECGRGDSFGAAGVEVTRRPFVIGRAGRNIIEGGELIPQAQSTLASARASYAVGRVDFLTTLSAFVSLLEYRLREVEERGNLWRALAEIAPLVGETPLGEPIGGPP